MFYFPIYFKININSKLPLKPQALPENLSPQIFVCLQTNYTCIGKNGPAKHQWCTKKKILGGLKVVSLFLNKKNMIFFLYFEMN
jgi:hypothetical protein